MSLEALRVIKFRCCLQRAFRSAFRTLCGREISKIDVRRPATDWMKLRDWSPKGALISPILTHRDGDSSCQNELK
jgi:hypothetical protein